MSAKTISIPTVLKIGAGTLDCIGNSIKQGGIENVVIYFGNGLINMFGDRVMKSCKDAGVHVFDHCELDTVDIDDIIDLAFAIDPKVQGVVGIGGGKVIDAAKYAGYLRKLPFFSVPTSSSSDGFSSASASLIINGRRNTTPAALAYGIIVDTDVISSAPERFIYSGIGDLVAKITSLYDWVYEDTLGVTTLNDFSMMIAKKAVNSFVRTPFETIHDRVFLKELLDSLAMCGIANEIAGSSSPTSGSEHLISHALDKMLEHPQLHGVQVGVATYLMSMVQDHRYVRVRKIFTDTGFFAHVKTLGMKRSDFEAAVDLAPSMKPYRHTYLHEEKYRTLAKQYLREDEILTDILVQ